MAPTHALCRSINGHIQDHLARDGVIRGPALEEVDRLVSHGYTTAEKSLAAPLRARRHGKISGELQEPLVLGKGTERHVADVDHATGTVMLEGKSGEATSWQARRVGGRRGAVEIYRTETIELRVGDRIRWTRNDASLGLVNSHTAEVHSVEGGGVSFRLEAGRMPMLGKDSPQLRHLDHAWASTVHVFQRRTVDNVTAVMEANHPQLTTQKSFYVEISRARHCAELITEDAGVLREHLEAVTGERVSALEGIWLKPGRTVRSDRHETVQMLREDRLGEQEPPQKGNPPKQKRVDLDYVTVTEADMPRRIRPMRVSEPVRAGKSITMWSGRRCTESLAAEWHSFGSMRPIRDSLNHDWRLLSANKTINDEPKMRCAT